jgi:hypothetical protein
LVEVDDEFAPSLYGDVVDVIEVLHVVVGGMEDGLEGRGLQGLDEWLHLTEIVLLEPLGFDLMLDEGQHVVVASDALNVPILLNHAAESPISRDFLPIVVEGEQIELELEDDLDQQALYFVHLPLQRDVQQ